MSVENRIALPKRLLIFILLTFLQDANTFITAPSITFQKRHIITILLSKKQSRSTLLKKPKEEETKKEEVYGAKFFGGNAVKEELFDSELEANADRLQRLYPKNSTVLDNGEPKVYRRFEDKNAFPDEESRIVGQRLQSLINHVLYETKESVPTSLYSPKLEWKTPFLAKSSSRNPLNELSKALDFYKRVDVAIISAKTGSSASNRNMKKMEVRWEVSVLWPNAFESRVLITGVSTISVDFSNFNSPIIVSQTDILDLGGKDGQDIFSAISSQLQPRFWDLYHVSMTPSAEFMPRVNQKGGGLFALSYSSFEIPPRLVMKPTVVDYGDRNDREAEGIPNHSFTCIIKTTGQKGQRYVPTSPVGVSIRRQKLGDEKGRSLIEWSIPLPPEFLSYADDLPLPNLEEENQSSYKYVYQSRRFVATMAYGGSPQDKEVVEVRKKLYEKVLKECLKPKLDEEGRPQFFFLQNDVKACFTANGGLGMGVYDWRPKSANANEVGIELEF